MEIQELILPHIVLKATIVQYTTSCLHSRQSDAALFGVMFQRTALPKPLSCGFDDVWGSEWLQPAVSCMAYADGTDCRSLEICMETGFGEIADHQSVYRASLSGKRLRYLFAGACQTAGNAA